MTEQKRAEQKIEALVRLSDLIRDAGTLAELSYATGLVVGEALEVSRVGYGTVNPATDDLTVERDWNAEGVQSIAGTLNLRDFGSFVTDIKAGKFIAIADVREDARTAVAAEALEARHARSFVNFPIVEKEKAVAILYINYGGVRQWSEDDLAFIKEVGERTRSAIERLRATEELRDSEIELRELNEQLEARVAAALAERKVFSDVIDGSTAAVTALDQDFRILAINRANIDAFERVYGKRPRVGDKFLELFDDMPEHVEQQRAIWQRALDGHESIVVQAFGDQQYERRHYEVRFSALHDIDGNRIGASSTSYDVTAKVQAEQQLEAAQAQLRQSQKMDAMGQLTGGVAHDFNNLLGPIVGSLDMLQRGGLGGEREQRMIANALQSADRARVLVQRLLAFARRQPLQAEAVDVVALIEGMADLIGSTSGPSVKVEIDVASDLPPARADANQIEMALLNLAVNARDAMPDGGRLIIGAASETVEGKHRVGLTAGRYVRLSVADSGVGMDEATMARAIEPFFSTKGIGKGTGLGLSMVHGLAAQLGGGLAITSKPGLGTKVELWLPVSAEAVEPVHVIEAPAGAARAGTALVVDDEELVRVMTADMLEDLGFAVIEAASAEEAMRLFGDGLNVDLVVTDHLMPGMNGTELVRRLRIERPNLPALLVSGYADVEGVTPDVLRLVKPFRQADLEAAIAELVAG